MMICEIEVTHARPWAFLSSALPWHRLVEPIARWRRAQRQRSIPGIGAAKAAELQAVSQKSCSVLQALGHARRGGFPANSVARVATIIDPTTAEA